MREVLAIRHPTLGLHNVVHPIPLVELTKDGPGAIPGKGIGRSMRTFRFLTEHRLQILHPWPVVLRACLPRALHVYIGAQLRAALELATAHCVCVCVVLMMLVRMMMKVVCLSVCVFWLSG